MVRSHAGSAQNSRYVEEVHGERDLFADVWVGVEEDADVHSVQSETLELREDGSFKHSLAHHLMNRNGSNCASSCHGRWRLYNVKFLGADESAIGDREIGFERGTDSPPLHVDRLVVCGSNPRLNGFVGVSCRLYPESVARERQTPGATSSNRPRGTEQSEADRAHTEVQIGDDQVQQLREISGFSADECLAVLMEHEGCIEDALTELLERPNAAGSRSSTARADSAPSRDGGASGGNDDGVDAVLKASSRERQDTIDGLVEMSGKTRSECEAALDVSGGRAHVAAAHLLGLAGQADSSQIATASSATVPTTVEDVQDATLNGAGAAAATNGMRSSHPAATSEDLRAKVSSVVEATGATFAACEDALRKCGGRPDDAVSLLLGFGEAEVAETHPIPSEAQEQALPEEADEDYEEDVLDEGMEDECGEEETVAGDPELSLDVDLDNDRPPDEGALDDADEFIQHELSRKRARRE